MLDVLAAEDWRLVPLAGAVCAMAGLGGFIAWNRLRKPAADPVLQRLRQVIDVMPEGLALFDADDRIVMWNARYSELNDEGGGSGLLVRGARFRDLLQSGLDAGIYPEAVGREAEWLDERLALHRAERNTLEQPRLGDRWLRIEERRTPDGGVLSVCEDITELKRREASFRLMFESNPAPMWVVDAENRRFLAVNDATVAHYGYSREQFLGMTLEDIYVAEEAADLGVTSDHIVAHGAYRGERVWTQRRADGTEIFSRPYVQRLRYHDREAFMAAQFDVTLSKRAEEAMSQARDEAEAANRAKSEFLANMSHEIRTPLNGVAGVAQVLARTPLNDHQQEMVRIIESSAATLERLLTDVLDLARVEAGHVEVREERFDLCEAVQTTAGLSELRAKEKGVGFELDIAPEARGEVVGDVGRLKQILFNLLSNALKFTSKGEIGLRVTVLQDGPAPVYRFEVRDTGVGFDPACKERLFRRFEQEDGSITRRFGGTGLGLAISRDLSELMGGRLDARSTPGEGSVFTLELPLRRGEAEATPGAHEPAPPEPAARLRVLLAEDHAINRQVVELMLQGAGVDLSCVENGEEAVQAVLTERFDVVLMDMQMPVMDGLTAVRAIRAHERETGAPRNRIFVLSANAMADHARNSLAAGADRHLTKPVSAPVLLGALVEVAQQKAQAGLAA